MRRTYQSLEIGKAKIPDRQWCLWLQQRMMGRNLTQSPLSLCSSILAFCWQNSTKSQSAMNPINVSFLGALNRVGRGRNGIVLQSE